MTRLTRIRTIRRRFSDVPFAVALAAVGINAALTAFLAPERQPAALLVAPLDYVWAGMYGCGGLLILAGIGTARANLEAAGCLAYGGGASISAVATAAVRGWPAANTTTLLAIIAAAALVRAHHLARGRVLVLVDAHSATDHSVWRQGPE